MVGIALKRGVWEDGPLVFLLGAVADQLGVGGMNVLQREYVFWCRGYYGWTGRVSFCVTM